MFSRRWTYHVSAAFLAFSLAACGNAPTTNTAQPGAAAPTVEQTEVPSIPTVVATPTVAEPTVEQPATTGGQTAEDIAKRREQWMAQNLTNYRYTIERSCMCVETARGPVVVEVKSDQPATVTNVATNEAGGEYFADVDSITKIFAMLEQQAKDGADEIVVTYDEKNGVPLTIKVDVDFQAADEELYYTISNFESIQ